MYGLAKWNLAATGLAVAFMASWTTANAQTADGDKAKIRDLESRLSKIESVSAGTKLSEGQREETKNLVAEMLNAAKKDMSGPDWAKGLKFSGDFRLRYEARMFNEGNNNITGTQFNNNWGGTTYTNNGSGAWPASSTPTFYNWADKDTRYPVPTRNLYRMRLRFGFEKTYKDADLGDFKVEFRLASGNSNDPTSTNQTLGNMNDLGVNTPGYAKRPIWIDLAYATYQPKFLPGLSITGGKMKNPFLTNDIFWDSDVNPEGVWVKYAVPNLMDGKLVPWFGVGMFSIAEQANQWSDSLMWAYELGVSYKVTDDVKLSFATRYMDYQHYDECSAFTTNRGNVPGPIPNLPGSTALDSGLAPAYTFGDRQFGVIDLITKAEFNIPIGSYKLPLEVWFDWAHNCKDSYSKSQFIAFDQLTGSPTAWAPAYNSGMNPIYGNSTSAWNPNYSGASDAYAVGIKAGQNKKKGDWSVGYKFAYIEANAMPGYWTDSDFGFANRKGHVISGTYNLMDDLTIGCSVFITQPVYSPNVTQTTMFDNSLNIGNFNSASIDGEDKTVIVQADLVWKF
ncbi:MAG: putative porin [Planctomycetes bacterium]|nr:putative porin [Planctomycetota bacterium]